MKILKIVLFHIVAFSLGSCLFDSNNNTKNEFLDVFDKNRLMIGAMAGSADNASFWQKNKGLLDVRYMYLADAFWCGPTDVPTVYNSAVCNMVHDPINGRSENNYMVHPNTDWSPAWHWWGWWQDRTNTNLPPGQYLRSFLNDCSRDGVIPMITRYTFYQSGQTHCGENREGRITELGANVEFLTKYFNDFRFMCQIIGENKNRKVILHIEPDLLGYGRQLYKCSPNNIAMQVKAANPIDGAGFDNTFAGFGKCLISMARKYAPNALVGFHASAWGTASGASLDNNRNAGMDLKADAAVIANDLLELGAGGTDFIALDPLDRDADYYMLTRTTGNGQPDNRWWDAANKTLPNFAQHFTWVAELKQIVGLPLVWWQIPLGNAASPNTAVTDINSELAGGYKDNRVDYFMDPEHINEIVKMGGVLLAFGAGQGDQTNPLSDGGNFMNKVKAYKQSNAGYF